jgi:hypothetical protein
LKDSVNICACSRAVCSLLFCFVSRLDWGAVAQHVLSLQMKTQILNLSPQIAVESMVSMPTLSFNIPPTSITSK